MESSEFPTKKEVDTHYKAQDRSVFRPPYDRDPGHTILNSISDTKSVIQAELEGQQVNLFKTRNPATTYFDPMARAQSLLQEYHRKGLTAEEFQEQVSSPAEHLLYLIIYGNMSDHQRAGHTDKLAKLLFQEQKRQEDLLHREKQIEDKRTRTLLQAKRLQQEMIEREEKKAREAQKQVDDE